MNGKANRNNGRLSFTIAVLVLGLAAVGLNGATKFMKLYFQKLPVSLSLPLKEVPKQLGPWRFVGMDKPLPSDIEHTLGTEEYIFRTYVDTRVVKPDVMKALEDVDLETDVSAQERLQQIRQQYPAACLTMAVTYYTGLVDTVAHIPDRCMVADGYQPTTDPEVVTWDVKPHAPVEARYITFEDQTSRGAVNRNVAYFFHVNGEYESDPITGVRLRLQKLTERHGYYAKIELTNMVKDQGAAKAAMADFLGSGLPDIEKCMPDWAKVKADERAGK
jgi:hypothetical protein